ncbi:MAG: dihydrodipicolinate synthase family protein [Acidobacteria bacterium]|nr:dihydrodipicolinate synthase family protein [Acidobacteriota bacterium]
MAMFLSGPLHDLVAATHTPFADDGALAVDVVPVQAAFLAARSIRTVFISGSTGECHSLTHAERLALYDAWADAGPAHGVTVIAHVGGNAIGDARVLARHAASLGLAATSAMAPSYFKPASVTALVDWCAAIAAEATDLPFYFYDIPALTGVALPMDRFLPEAMTRIPNFAGIKFTNPDLIAYRRCLDVTGDRADLPWGVDESLLGALATGARGGVGSTYNFAPGLYRALIAAFERGDMTEAQRLQSQSIALVDAIAATGYLGTAKALMARLGVPVGRARAPLANPTDAQVDALMERVRGVVMPDAGHAAMSR